MSIFIGDREYATLDDAIKAADSSDWIRIYPDDVRFSTKVKKRALNFLNKILNRFGLTLS